MGRRYLQGTHATGTEETLREKTMTLEPLLNASFAIQVHVAAALAAFVLGLVQFAAPKGVRLHRVMGWSWVALMVAVAGSSFRIHEIKTWGDWSPIHLLSIFTLVMLPLGVFYARRRNVRGHKITMIFIFTGALVIAGLFTLAPGRLMHTSLFGN
jgi:uncharacterized membrane protein